MVGGAGVMIRHMCQSALLVECLNVEVGVLDNNESALARVSYVSCQSCKKA